MKKWYHEENVKIFDGIYLIKENAVYLSTQNIIVLADLHIGYESALLEEEGFAMPKVQKDWMQKKLVQIIEKYQPRKIIINGDFKHEFGRNLPQEWEESLELMDFMRKNADIELVRGNHDNFLRTIASRVGVKFHDVNCRLPNVTILHGHKPYERKNRNEHLLIAHEHPSVKLRDELGAVLKPPCFIVDRKEKLICLPSFSPLAAGTDLTAAQGFLSPILAATDPANWEIYVPAEDGILKFGCLEGLRNAL